MPKPLENALLEEINKFDLKATQDISFTMRIANANDSENPPYNINASNDEGLSPLHLAVQGAQTEIVKELLKFKEIDINIGDNNDVPPLYYALENNHENCSLNIIYQEPDPERSKN